MRTTIAHRAAFVSSVVGGAAGPLARRDAVESVAARLERAQHGLHDLLAAAQKVGGWNGGGAAHRRAGGLALAAEY